MRTVYAIQLELEPKDNQSSKDLFKEVCGRVETWVKDKYKRTWSRSVLVPYDGSSQSPVEGHMIGCTLKAAEDSDFFSLDWTHPEEGDLSTKWVTSCFVARNDDLVQIAVLLRISTSRIVLRPVQFVLGRPRIVNELLDSYRTYIDKWPVPTSVELLKSPMVQSFVDDVLLKTNRTRPVIMLSPDLWNEEYTVDPDLLFSSLKGFAHVVKLADKWAAFKLTDILEKQLSCFDGAVRIYWPNFRLEDDPYVHKLFLPSSIRNYNEKSWPLQKRLFRYLATIASFRYTEGRVIMSARQALASEEKIRVEELRNQVKSGSVEKDNLENQLLEALEKIDNLTCECEQLKSNLVAQKAAWAEVQQAMPHDESDAPDSQSEQQILFDTVSDAVNKAKKDFTGSLIFLDSVFDSAKDSPYKSPGRVYEFFEALCRVAGEWRSNSGQLGRAWKEAMADLGFEISDNLSMTTKGKWGEQYKFFYKGRRILFKQHITIGAGQPAKCLSVHWYRDDADLVLAVGYCGRHLTNTRS